MRRECKVKQVRCKITGRVQGVWFRGSAQEQAIALGVTGWARNEPDGSVIVLACGDDGAVDRMVEWLHEGPRLAQVDSVEIEEADDESPPSFEVL
jgi:acylphosphatase